MILKSVARVQGATILNDGTGRFEAGSTFGTPSSTRSLTLADLDGDGHEDILVVNRGRQNFIFHGDGSGEFREGTPFGAGDDSTIDVAAADLDGDGDPDLVLANRDGGANTIHWNDGGSFERVRNRERRNPRSGGGRHGRRRRPGHRDGEYR